MDRLESFLVTGSGERAARRKVFFVDGRKEQMVTASNQEHPASNSQVMLES